MNEPECPGPDCPMCCGEACALCGAGTRTRVDEPPCEHDDIERHTEQHEPEAPCEVTGKPCNWLSDDEYDGDELIAWDLFCADCHRSRDWSKDEAPPVQETPATPSATGQR